MIRRFSLPVLALFLALWLSGATSLFADASDDFLKAYMEAQQAEKYEKQNRLPDSLKSLESAVRMLEAVKHDSPDWQPLVVDYRIRKTMEALTRVRERVGVIASSTPVTPAPASPAETADTPDPRITANPETASLPPRPAPTLSEPESTPPTVSIVPPTHPAPQPSRPVPPPQPAVDTAALVSRATRELRERIDALQAELSRSRTDLSSAQDERARFARLLGESQMRLQDALTAIDKSKMASAEDRAKIQELEEALRQTQSQIAQRNSLVERITNLENQILDERAEREAAEEENMDLAGTLIRTREQLAEVGTERDTAITELAEARKSQAELKKLVAENASLSTQLAAAQTTITQLREDAPKKGVEIAMLKDEIIGLKEQLAISQKQSKTYQTSITELHAELEKTNQDLASMKTRTDMGASELTQMTKENELLRNLFGREMKQQAMRDQARKLVLEEMEKLDQKSDLLVQQAELLAQPVLELTDEERALLRIPKVVPSDVADTANNPTATPATPATVDSSVSLSISAPKEVPGGEKSAAPTVETNIKPDVPIGMEVLARSARENFDRGEYREAEKAYESMLSSAPENLYVLSNLGVTRFRAGKLKSAEMALKKALEVQSEDPFCLSTLGIVYYSQKRFDDAVDILTRALTANPKNAVAHNYLGITSSQKGWQEAAEKEIQAALAINPNYADAHFNMAVIYATSQPPSMELARRHYQKAVELGADPDPALEKLIAATPENPTSAAR